MSPVSIRTFLFASIFYSTLVSSSAVTGSNRYTSRRGRHGPSRHQLTTRGAPILPAGWAYIGCRQEPQGITASGRILSTNIFTSTTHLTQENCAAVCNAYGYTYAGMEYGQECWCGSSLNSPQTVPESDCNMPCSGDPTQECGAGYILSLFGKTGSGSSSTAVTWSSVGCYTDNSARVLPSSSYIDASGMTVERCQAFCIDFAYSGVENAQECYCGNTLSASTSGAVCNAPCKGNSLETCGGTNWAISIYKKGSAPAPSSSSSTTTSHSTTTTASSTTTSTSHSTSSTTHSTTSSTSVSPTTAKATSSSTSTVSTSVVTPVSGKWNYYGCFDDTSPRNLNGASLFSNTMTQEACFSFCQTAGYTMAGLENGGQCFCGNSLQNSTPYTGCTVPCVGNSSETCGGPWRLQVYTSSNPSSTSSSRSSTITSSTSTSATHSSTTSSSSISSSSATTTSKTTTTSSSTSTSATHSSTTSSSSISSSSATTTSKATTTTSNTSSTTTASATPTSTFLSVGCFQDSNAHLLSISAPSTSSGYTLLTCGAYCGNLKYAYLGLENGNQCYCGNHIALSSTSGVRLAPSSCQTVCTADPTKSTYCGGSSALGVFYSSALDTGAC